MKKLNNIHPGEILLEEFLKPMGISQTRLANAMGVLPRRINEIVLGKRAITADTALRLAKVLGTSEQFRMGLQDEYELRESSAAILDKLDHLTTLLPPRRLPSRIRPLPSNVSFSRQNAKGAGGRGWGRG